VVPAPAAVPPSRPAAQQPQVAQQQPAPVPVPAPSVPAPAVQQPVAPAPQPVAENRPAPQPAPETPAPAAGNSGGGAVTPAKLTRRGTVPYPPIARQQRIGGRVLMSVHVSETGQVLDVKMLSGIKQRVGLNEAAEQMMRRSTFQPGRRDGQPIASWITVPVDFQP
jgi:protein TonB